MKHHLKISLNVIKFNIFSKNYENIKNTSENCHTEKLGETILPDDDDRFVCILVYDVYTIKKNNINCLPKGKNERKMRKMIALQNIALVESVCKYIYKIATG